MRDPVPPEVQELAQLVRRIAPPPGAEERVRQSVQSSLRGRQRRRRLWLGLAFVPAAAVAAGVAYRATVSEPPPQDAHRVQPTGISDSSAPEPPQVTTPRTVPEPRPSTAPEPPTPAAKRVRRRHRPRQRVRHRPAAADASATAPSPLALQVTAYRNALALRKAAPQQALEQLRAMRQRWPNSALAHEVDLRIIETLIGLRQFPQARAEARRFARRHPRSPKLKQIRRLVQQPASGSVAPNGDQHPSEEGQ